MRYCQIFYSTGQNFSANNYTDGHFVNITFPPGCVDALLPSVFIAIRDAGGKTCEPPALSTDGTATLSTVKFPDQKAAQECCEKIEKMINDAMSHIHPISIIPLDDSQDSQGSNVLINLNLRALFIKFQELMEGINPAIQYIENNGGWFNPETNKFPGVDALELALKNGILTPEQSEEINSALNAFVDFMVNCYYGEKAIKRTTPLEFTLK